MEKVALLVFKIGTVPVQKWHYSQRFRKLAMFMDYENTKTYILIPKVHENIEKYENQIRYKDFRSFSLFSLFSEL